jgi:hypothetical protein
MVLAFSDDQIDQIKTAAAQVPPALRDAYLRRLSELLPQDFGDADVWRASHRAACEIMEAPRKSA